MHVADDGSLLVQNAYNYKEYLKQIGAKWMPELKAWRLSPYVSVSELMAIMPGLVIDNEVEKMIKHVSNLKKLHFASTAEVKHPDGLDSYQRVGVRFLADAKRAILADDVGLGKTAQAIRAAMEVDSKHVLVITKKSLLHNWTVEIKRWANSEAFTLTTQNTLPYPSPKFTVTNYEAAVRRLEELKMCSFDVLIVDEAAAIKNRRAQRSRAIHKLAKDIPYVWLLTATPMPNSPEEIWSLLHCIRPDVYSSYWRFVEKHCDYDYNFFGGTEIHGLKDPNAFAEEVAPLMLRRDKSLLNLPPVTQETIWLTLDGEQRRIYKDIRDKFLAVLDEEHIVTAPSVLAQLTRLRQVVCSPALVGGPDESAKTEALLEILEDLTPKHKVLVFTTFADYVRLLLPKLEPFGVVAITGDTPAQDRTKAVQKLNKDPNCRVFIGTIQAAGEGLNLQAADIVIFLNKSWTPAENEIQAVGRAHRRGQVNPVHVINLTAVRTIDEYIEEVLLEKKHATDAVEHLAERLRKEVF
ncbi:DEAD/DEAH box helicase [Caldanaerobius polysaccharolyticus]|uniref:DEAD/DEAH box helicase n=1 Tax=Caldanaerobius polysaccharolyticus TaxID=44256 RepID=UPI00047EDD85|nr:DEAD/DEAH box helicase [Caldanaerobius polysaccharolyticus]